MNLFTPAELAANYSAAGAAKTKLSIGKMLLLGILAGMLIGFPSCVTNMASYALENNSTVRMISGILFAFGLGMVVIMGAELFTGNTLISISVMDGKASIGGLLRNWVFVYIGNFLGSMLVAVVCAKFGWLGAGKNALAVFSMKVAQGKMTMPFQNAFFMGVFCNVLVTLGVLMSLAAKDITGRFIGAWGPVMFFVVCGFNHSIADMTYCMLGLFAKTDAGYVQAAADAGLDIAKLTWGNYFLGNMIPVTLGNIVGGVFVGFIVWYGFLRGKKQ
jgi:formate/nitrite transporter